GRAERVGRGGEWFLTEVAAAAWQVIDARDGSPAAVPQLDQRTAVARVSPAGTAFALVRGKGAALFEASLYAVRDRAITYTGQISYVGGRPAGLGVAHDGRSIAEGDGGRVWRVGDVGGTAHAGATPVVTEPADPPQDDAPVVSPMGGFEVRVDQKQDPGDLRVVRRSDSKVVRDFTLRSPAYRFSQDDRWLAVWAREEHSLEVLDLDQAEILFHFDPSLAIDDAAFAN